MFTVPYHNVSGLADAAVVFDSLQANAIACNNWSGEFPYSPDVSFRMFHNGSALFLRYDVQERSVRALAAHDGDDVYMDSCVECFIQPEVDGRYYNFEFNAAGVLDLSCRTGREEWERASAEVFAVVQRHPSLGREPFAEREADGAWSLSVAIPATALFNHAIGSWSGLHARMNLYKCGDGLAVPHFLSWQPVGTPNPDFHRPEYFVQVVFEQGV